MVLLCVPCLYGIPPEEYIEARQGNREVWVADDRKEAPIIFWMIKDTP